MKPFFSNQVQDWVIEEVCECGHLRSEHGSLVKKINAENSLRLSDEGSCCNGTCQCSQYRFGKFITAEELSEIKKTKSKRKIA